MLVLIGKLSPSILRWVPICQGFGDFSGFLHYFVLAKLATSSIRVINACFHLFYIRAFGLLLAIYFTQMPHEGVVLAVPYSQLPSQYVTVPSIHKGWHLSMAWEAGYVWDLYTGAQLASPSVPFLLLPINAHSSQKQSDNFDECLRVKA